MDKYPIGSPMQAALRNFGMCYQEEYRRLKGPSEFTWQDIYKYVNDILYKDHRAYMAPSDKKFVYVSFEAEQDKTAFLLKWG